LFKYVFIGLSVIGTSIAMEDEMNNAGEMLIIGCRPWDENVQGVEGIENAYFVDFMNNGVPNPPPENFHHRDINDAGQHGAANFSELVNFFPEHFNTIIIDWMTYQHIHRAAAWNDFETLLTQGGKLVIPVTSSAISSFERARQIGNSLPGTFAPNLYSYETMPQGNALNLLRRPAIAEIAQSFMPSVIIATKHNNQ
jgi:hypothetical protein